MITSSHIERERITALLEKAPARPTELVQCDECLKALHDMYNAGIIVYSNGIVKLK